MNIILLLSNLSMANAAPAAQNGIMQFAPLIIIFALFYFLVLRPQKKKLDQEAQLLNELKKGDEIYTKSGLLGKIYGLTDKVVTLETEDGVKLKVLKSQIGGLSDSIFNTEKK